MLQSNTFNKIISVVVAIVVWAYVISAVNPPITKTIRDVPIKFENVESLEERGLAVSADEEVTVDVVIEGKRSDIADITADDITATADLLGFPKGLNTVKVELTVPDEIDRAEARPENIQVLIEDLISVSKPVNLEFKGEFKSGTEAGQIQLAPEQVEVSGPRSKVDSVTQVVVSLNAAKLTDNEQTYTLDAKPVNVRAEEIKGVSLSQDTVDVTAQLSYTKTVPLGVDIIGEVASDFEVDEIEVPDSVKIKGAKGDIEDIERVTASAVDISGIDVTTDIPLEINLPDGVELANDSQNISVKILLKGISNKSFTYQGTAIEIDGLAAGYTAHVNTGVVDVTVFGKDSVIEDFTKSDLRLFVNLENVDLDAGTVTVPVEFRYTKKLTKAEATPQKVYIIIKKEE